MTKSPLSRHPSIVFSDTRAKAWHRDAVDEDFYRYLDGLVTVYAKRLYENDSNPHKNYVDYEPRLVEDYNKWKEKNPW